ncbi:NirD/YgiW/YdeI family stress tolerance protein [Aliivibrio fischeri]|uniref:NirD/YgiW/YdeI family stress tolerance protein n=1 Tax=Aliivibrio fischeri TaxID=668 RepID=UPI0007C5118E|nr:NirD/YgiW/YdeI family stress tolerance protein [Aliivibrio fischeri]MCE7555266.1 NirD/YgiW/YdeI family stress tolerance protein [Aliivibrio fischeri]MCE7562534.1 NirD/YgiW/YdeI family stress tolerance protein [Aliivibrio fischeri]MCE7565960.1 NirD/YgiW/YdeI family stress tolerance protein [Aliivibrio fischeri]MCE7569942.1 NirD/YgiW/YdeI family stress tolerance protein [Aliivibrio fischeri]
MKKILFLIALISSSSFAANTTNRQGFSGPVYGLKSVKAVLDAGVFSDDTPVTLTGSLAASLGGSLYVFTDASGTISVNIDYSKWRGLKVTPETAITIQGQINKTFTETTIDVESIKLVK